jgi:hypothetical protein
VFRQDAAPELIDVGIRAEASCLARGYSDDGLIGIIEAP